MSGKGNSSAMLGAMFTDRDQTSVALIAEGRLSHDNAMVETVFKTIKSELIWRTVYKTRQQAQAEITQEAYPVDSG
jgi:hypothetical protein